LNETALENAVIQIAAWTDERGLLIAAQPRKLIVPPGNQFVATRLLETELTCWSQLTMISMLLRTMVQFQKVTQLTIS
jgi:phage major head subunit gpT-like protein